MCSDNGDLGEEVSAGDEGILSGTFCELELLDVGEILLVDEAEDVFEGEVDAIGEERGLKGKEEDGGADKIFHYVIKGMDFF